MTPRFRIPLILQIFLFLVPMNIYVIGDGIGSGIQWLLFRYTSTSMGNGFIFLSREIGFVGSGILSGRSALSTGIWALAAAIIVIATILAIYAYLVGEPSYIRFSAILNFSTAVLLILAIVLQYGISLNGPSGISVPLGIPVILIVAIVQYYGLFSEYDPEEEIDLN
ncbi:MAG: hypothetical protein ABSB80_11830 [Methanoregula sp.]|jgi:hypothetical protein|uniref:hypothetical protein n=1 Tax=Methanoregula sp. TaxID=2052170 RepID=UPI003D1322C1